MNAIQSFFFFLFPFQIKEKRCWQSLLLFPTRHSCPCLCIYICDVLIPKSISGKSHTPASFFLYLKRLKSKGRGRKVKNGIAKKTLNK